MTSLRNSLLVAVVGAAAVACAVDLVPLGPEGQLTLPTELENRPVFRPPPVRGEGFVLIDGVRKLTIVTYRKKDPDHGSGFWTLGDELKYHLEEMSGETVDLVEPKNRPASGPVIVIGRDDGKVPEGTSIVRWDGKDELYIGGEGAGVSHALTYVLEALGCRYLFPGKEGKIIPKKRRVVLPDFELDWTPTLKVRIVRLPSVGNSTVNENLEALGIVPSELSAALKTAVYDRTGNRNFWQWHGVNDATIVKTDEEPYSEVVRAGHHFTNYWDLYKDEHPEWFSLQDDGSREQTSGSPRLCTSNPELRANIVEECVGRLDASPEMKGISICMPDGGYDSFCLCEECRKLDPVNAPAINGSFYRPSKHPYTYVSLTDRMIDFSNAIQSEVRKLRPGKSLVSFAYSNYVLPPVLLRPDPDLVFFNVAGSYVNVASELKARSNLAGWLSLGNPIVWRPNCLKGFDCPCPMNFGRKLFDDVELFKPNGIVGVSFDCGNAEYASRGFMFYMLAKAILNPDRLDYDTIAADWLASGFGPAADRVAAYLAELERIFRAAARRAIGERGYLEAMDTERLDALLDAAVAAAGGDADVLARIAYLRVGIDHAREAKKVYRAWATGSTATLAVARDAYRAWIAEEGLRHPFEFPHTCTYMAGGAAYKPEDDGELMDGDGPDEMVLTDDRTVDVPAGTTNFVGTLRGGPFTLVKTGEGVLQIGRVASEVVSIVVEEGTVALVNPHPACLASAFFHVDASAADTLVTELRHGTNFVTRWNDADGRANRFAGPLDATYNGRTDPTKRLPFLTDGRLNGRTYVDFGTLALQGYTNAAGVAIGWGGALAWSEACPMRHGFTVVSDTPDIDEISARYEGSGYNGCAMSFFSRFDGHAGYRGSFSATHRPYIYNDNSYNGPFIHGTNYLNGIRSAYKRGFPSGFQLFEAQTSTNATINAFGGEYRYSSGAQRMFGGTRIAEHCVFTNVLEEADRRDVTRYLQAKWFPKRIPSVTLLGDAQLVIDDEARLEIGEIVRGKSADLRLHAGEVRTVDTIGGLDVYARFDASERGALVTEARDGTNFVTRWNASNDATIFATNYWGTADHALGKFRPDPERRLPYVTADFSSTGLPVVDFGSFLSYRTASGVGDTTGSEGYGAAMVWSKRGGSPVREFFTVAADDTARTWPTHSSTRGIASYLGTVAGTGNGLRGSSGKLFDYWSSLSGTKVTSEDATVFLDGTNVPYSTKRPSAGLHVVNNVPGGAVSCDAFAHQHRKSTTGYTIDTYGGLKIGEFIGLKTAIADDETRSLVNAHLLHKWTGAPKGVRAWRNLTVPSDASLTVVFEDVCVSNRLSIGGTLAVGRVAVANLELTAAGAEIDGILDLGTCPGTLTVSIADAGTLAGRTVRLLGFHSVCGSLDGWTVENRTGERAVITLKEDGIYGKFGKTGFLILVK